MTNLHKKAIFCRFGANLANEFIKNYLFSRRCVSQKDYFIEPKNCSAIKPSKMKIYFKISFELFLLVFRLNSFTTFLDLLLWCIIH